MVMIMKTSTEKGKMTDYPSIDKPWLKYYSEEAIKAPLPECTIYEYLCRNNEDYDQMTALEYFGQKINYGSLIDKINETAKAFIQVGVEKGDYVSFCTVTTPEVIYAFYALNRLGAAANMIDPRTNADRIRD